MASPGLLPLLERVDSPGRQEACLCSEWTRAKALGLLLHLYVPSVHQGPQWVVGRVGPCLGCGLPICRAKGFHALHASFISDVPGLNGSCWSLEGADQVLGCLEQSPEPIWRRVSHWTLPGLSGVSPGPVLPSSRAGLLASWWVCCILGTFPEV